MPRRAWLPGNDTLLPQQKLLNVRSQMCKTPPKSIFSTVSFFLIKKTKQKTEGMLQHKPLNPHYVTWPQMKRNQSFSSVLTPSTKNRCLPPSNCECCPGGNHSHMLPTLSQKTKLTRKQQYCS